MSPRLAIVPLIALSFSLPHPARAEPPPPPQYPNESASSPSSRVDYAFRVMSGPGAGDVGLGFMGALHGELWLGDVWGIGLQGGAIQQTALEFLGGEDRLTNTFVGATLGVRTAPGDNYGLFLLGPGYTHGVHLRRPTSFTLGAPANPDPEYTTTENGALLHTSLGWLWTFPKVHVQVGFAFVLYYSIGSVTFAGPMFQVGAGGPFGGATDASR